MQALRFVLRLGFMCGLLAGRGSLELHAATTAYRSEYELLRTLPGPALAGVITNTVVPGTNGLIGFQQQAGQWYEAGMQRGGCWMLIGAVLAGDQSRADAAWQSVVVTFQHQVADGGFLSNPKPDSAGPPTLPERVETAYFYLQELGHAILILEASAMEPHFHDRLAELRPRLVRACQFIQRGYGSIIPKVGHTANRLLIAAKAFGLCGVILEDETLKSSSRQLVQAALARRDADGVFVEKGGRDSSYDAVSVLMGQVLCLYLPNSELDAALARTMAWERTRILPTGEVQVAGNTRTGVGKEAFLGHPKEVNLREVVLAFSYFGMVHGNAGDLATAEKMNAWGNRPKSGPGNPKASL